MNMGNPPKVIDFGRTIDPMVDDLKKAVQDITQIEADKKENRKELNDLMQRMQSLAADMRIPIEYIPPLDIEFEELNAQIDNLLLANPEYVNQKYAKFPKLSAQDTIVCSLTGILAVLIDVVFVGTPEVVKLYRGGENFDGSILTAALRKIGIDDDGNLAPLLKWLSDKCMVPYDISSEKGVVIPNNHRLRSLAHDPFFGLFFAVADIILGTTTCIDNNGNLTILVNANKAPTTEKWLAVFYYMGHIISDMCTARGIPIPGFFITQFFTDEIRNSSIAKKAEEMYLDGYDLRHMASMSVPVFVQEILINMYLKLIQESPDAIMTIGEREKDELDFKLKTQKMKFVSNAIATTGNAVKFVAPPSCGNPCSLNMVQWMAFIQNSITMIAAETRDFSVEEAMYNRAEIDARWRELL
jgi:hypothetical protein